MFPDLFHIGSLPIRTFGVLLATAFFAGVAYIGRVTRHDKEPFDVYLIISYLFIFGGILGARLTYVFLHLSEFAENWSAVFNPFGGTVFGIAGMNLYGGVTTGLLLVTLFCALRKIPILKVFDYFAPALGLGLFFGRLGCFFNGCCFGTPTDLPWGVRFPVGSFPWIVFGDQLLHPAQLYSAAYGLGLFLTMHWLLKRKRFDGQPAAVFLIVESIFRTTIESVRYYENEMYFDLGGYHPTFNHFISAALIILGVAVYAIGYRRSRAPSSLRAQKSGSEN